MNTINYKEIEKFSRLSEEWWDPLGKFKPLHKFNPIRIQYIKETIANHFNLNGQKIKTLAAKMFSPGEYNIIWNGRDIDGHQLPSGVYFISIKSVEKTISQKVVLLK